LNGVKNPTPERGQTRLHLKEACTLYQEQHRQYDDDEDDEPLRRIRQWQVRLNGPYNNRQDNGDDENKYNQVHVFLLFHTPQYQTKRRLFVPHGPIPERTLPVHIIQHAPVGP